MQGTDINSLKELLPLLRGFDSQIVDSLCQLDQGAVEEGTRSAALVKEVADANAGFGICIAEPSVARVHRRRNILCLTSLVPSHIIPIKHLED